MRIKSTYCADIIYPDATSGYVNARANLDAKLTWRCSKLQPDQLTTGGNKEPAWKCRKCQEFGELLEPDSDVDIPVSENWECHSGTDLKGHVVSILFSRSKLSHLQKQVCSNIVAAISRKASCVMMTGSCPCVLSMAVWTLEPVSIYGTIAIQICTKG